MLERLKGLKWIDVKTSETVFWPVELAQKATVDVICGISLFEGVLSLVSGHPEPALLWSSVGSIIWIAHYGTMPIRDRIVDGFIDWIYKDGKH